MTSNPTDHHTLIAQSSNALTRFNPLYDIWSEHQLAMRTEPDLSTRLSSAMGKRFECAKKYSFAIPDLYALEIIKKYTKNGIEMGRGNGYWAHLLRCQGVHFSSAIAIDENTNRDHHWITHILDSTDAGAPDSFLRKSGKEYDTLLLVWPRTYEIDLLDAFHGNHFICVGERDYYSFTNLGWKEIETYENPHWLGLPDSMAVFERVHPLYQKTIEE